MIVSTRKRYEFEKQQTSSKARKGGKDLKKTTHKSGDLAVAGRNERLDLCSYPEIENHLLSKKCQSSESMTDHRQTNHELCRYN